MGDDLKRLIEGVGAETRRHFEAVAARLNDTQRRFDVVAERLEETWRHFDVVAERFESRLDLLAEGIEHNLDETRRIGTRLDQKIDSTAAETQAMIRFSHAELDRRVRALENNQQTLEESLNDLQSRVARLESSSH